ncbi:MAG: thiamine phosphate synthase [Defluviitaleaceae bacterium]|nr:thiamine phosphate synthase [Defluviitaleaceae bacterium]
MKQFSDHLTSEPFKNRGSSKIDYTLYLVTDSELMSTSNIEECVEHAVLGGCTVVQLREKTASSKEFFQTALRVREITDRLGVPLIINDRADIALAVDADGLHIGQDDFPYQAARHIIGQDKIIGVSVSSLPEALEAESLGADYLGVGAMFTTGTKLVTSFTSIDELRLIREKVSIPIVVIGGINKETIPLFNGIGIDGIAVVSAIVSQANIKNAAKELKLLFQA